jgi:hypothetical protein
MSKVSVPEHIENRKPPCETYCLRRGPFLLLDVPRLVAVADELAKLAGEVFVVEMDPVVGRELPVEDCRVIDDIVGHLGVLQGQAHRIVPGHGAFGGVDGNVGGFFEGHHCLVAAVGFYRGEEGGGFAAGEAAGGDAPHLQRALHTGRSGRQERAAPVIQEPVDGLSVLEGVVDGTVRLQVVRLVLIHRNEEVLRGGGGKPKGGASQQETGMLEEGPAGRGRGHGRAGAVRRGR